jgi:uncharacterized ubiquitin-like protein YukD
MKKRFFLFTISLCFAFVSAFAQTTVERQTISSGGAAFDMANESYMISATIGQPVAGTLSNENYTVTAGFQQTGLTLVNVFTAENAEVSVFPNPGTDFVMIKSDLKDYSLKVYDLRGVVVFSKTKTSGNFVVDVTAYNAGEYILQLLKSEGNLLSSTKLIKN